MYIIQEKNELEREWLQNLRILYVEDDQGIRRQLEQFLKRRCGDVLTAENGEDGLKLFTECKPDIVISDLLMPVMNGLEMIEHILKISPRTPIIITTAFNETNYLIKAIKLGVSAYVIKPIRTEYLTKELDKCARTFSYELAYKRSNELLRLILSCLNEAVFIINAEKMQLIYCNQEAEIIFGYTQQEMIGKRIDILSYDVGEFELFFNKILQNCYDCGCFEGEGQMKRKNGDIFITENFVRPLFDSSANDKPNLIWVVRDVTLQKQAENILLEHQAQLDFLAHHDPLTGLYNRRLFQDRLRHAIARADRTQEVFGLYFLDLDSFKPINDRYGHDIGDELLRTTANRLKLTLREQDTLCRLGGDEFVVIIENIGGLDVAGQVAEKMISVLSKPFEISGYSLAIGTSIGIRLYPYKNSDDIEDEKSLLNHADQSMYQAKQKGGNCFCIYGEGWLNTPYTGISHFV